MKQSAAKIITVFSCKGGVGKTTTTINLAGIYSLMNKRVLIMDLDLNGGGIAVSLNVDAEKTIFNAVDDIGNNRYDSISNYLSKYNDNIDVLAAPKDPRNAFKIDSKYVGIIISSCMYKYDVILIDTSHNLNAVTLTALDKSDNTLFLITNDPVDLKNARSIISIFNDTENNNYKIVLNASKDTGKDYFSLFDIKNIIKHNVDYTIDHSFYIKDIDKYVIDGKILTLDKKIRSTKKGDVVNLTKLANALLETKKVVREVKKDA
ncbi:MAG: AAA family ATPase [Bacilli bacterium]|nr:AAA family ATPase [Bacilli bacterium]